MEKREQRGLKRELSAIDVINADAIRAHTRGTVRHPENPGHRNSEKWLEKKLVSEVQRLGGLALKFWPVTFTGLPDRHILMPSGRVYFVELKSAGKKPTARQLKVHEQLRAMGFSVWVIDDELVLTTFLNHIR